MPYWPAHFRPEKSAKTAEPADAVPCIFNDQEDAATVYALRFELGQKIFMRPGDDFLPNVHHHVGFDGDDRRQNGTDKPPGLSPFGEVVDDEADAPIGLEGWTLAKELKEWREKNQPRQERKEAA